MNIFRPVYLSLGSNLENKIVQLQESINLISKMVGHVQKIASVYKTPAWGFEGPDFYNTCIVVNTKLNPEKLLETLRCIEQKLGRHQKTTDQYESRKIDIDIIYFDNEIIFQKELIVPHPKMKERKFVLAPLQEIAATFLDPIEKVSVDNLYKNTIDTSTIEKVSETLERPISLSEKYNYIAIEGNIGAGKTSLTKMISDEFNAKTVLERFADNPFLPKFYKDKDRYAFPLEMSFLADRYQQLTDDLAQFDLFKNFIVSDYYIFKSLIFAQVTLSKDEYRLYRKMFDIMYKEITKPDVYIFLHQNTDRLIDNIKKRGRNYEQNIERSYLEDIQGGYLNFIKTEKQLNTIVVDVSHLDFVNKIQDFNHILNLL